MNVIKAKLKKSEMRDLHRVKPLSTDSPESVDVSLHFQVCGRKGGP